MAETLLGAVERSDEEAGAPRRASALRRESIQWQATTAAVRNGLTFKEVFERVHSNDISGIEFDFDSMTVEEKEHLIMRAVPLSHTLKGFAAQFSSSISGDAEFKLSRPVDTCDDFLSHAWSTGRWQKWCALVYTYNLKASAVAWTIAHLLGVFFCAAVAPTDRSTIGAEYQALVIAVTVVLPILLQGAVLVYGAPSLASCVVPEPDVFLDKLCINQNHLGLKTLGINGLETFLKYSRRMVLLYDAATYTRLWCAFESAMFSKHSDVTNFVLVPCTTSFFGISMLALSHAATLLGVVFLCIGTTLRGWDPAEFFRALESRDHFVLWAEVLGVVMLPVYFLMAVLLRNRCREIETIQRTLRSFRLRDTNCYDPRDRELVERRIAQVWGEPEAFDKFVRETLADEMTNTVGAADLPPMWLDLVICLPWIPIFTVAGLLQTSNALPFWFYVTSTLLEVGIQFPFFIMFWYYFAYKIYQAYDAERPRLTVVLIWVWSCVNCLFGACVYGEAAAFALGLPAWQCAALAVAFFGAHQYGTYYFHHVEKRSTKCEWTLPSKAVVTIYWLVMLTLFNPRPAAIGCEHWMCVWPHAPL